MTYTVLIAPRARQRILEQARYIANEQGAPDRAAAWLDRVYAMAERLADMPTRFGRAREDAWCSYEVRHVPIGQFMLFFSVVEEAKTRSTEKPS